MMSRSFTQRAAKVCLSVHALIVVLCLYALTGCASLQYAGVASYTVEPFEIDGKLHCCRVEIHSGKEIAKLNALIEKHGDDYRVSLKQDAVEAFEGQRIAAGAASDSVGAAAKAATAVMVAPAAAAVGAAAVGALAR